MYSLVMEFKYSKPTFVRDDISSRFTEYKLVRDGLFCEKVVSEPTLLAELFGMGWFAARNTRDDKALANLVKFSCSRIKVRLQYVIFT